MTTQALYRAVYDKIRGILSRAVREISGKFAVDCEFAATELGNCARRNRIFGACDKIPTGRKRRSSKELQRKFGERERKWVATKLGEQSRRRKAEQGTPSPQPSPRGEGEGEVNQPGSGKFRFSFFQKCGQALGSGFGGAGGGATAAPAVSRVANCSPIVSFNKRLVSKIASARRWQFHRPVDGLAAKVCRLRSIRDKCRCGAPPRRR